MTARSDPGEHKNRTRQGSEPASQHESSDSTPLDDVILAGGAVNPDAIRRAVDSADQAAADDDAPNRVVFKLRRDLRKRLDKYLSDRIPFMSRTQLQRLIDEGGVTVNGRKPKASTSLGIGDVVEVFVPPPPSGDIEPEEIPLDVLYEDECLIVLNKQSDIIVHPARSHNSGTMLNALSHHFRAGSGALSTVGREFARPGVVHRLDRNTTGVIVFAKDDEAHWKIGKQFEARTVDKRYIALVHGLVEPAIDIIDLPLGPHPSKEKGHREKYVVRHDDLGKPSVTIYRVRERYPGPRGSQEDSFTLLELELKTGRTHQIRVHLSHLGWPIVGDDMYGGRSVTAADLTVDARSDEVVLARQALHAATLAFRHPLTGQPLKFTAPLPPDLIRVVSLLRKRAAGSVTLPPLGRMPPNPSPLQSPPGASVDLEALMGASRA